MGNEAAKEIFDQYNAKHGAVIRMLVEAVNKMAADGDGDSLLLTHQQLLVIVEIIQGHLQKAVWDPRARKARAN
jgi:hypothetical protein